MAKADITINLDAKCSQCGAKGTTDNGLCLNCITERIVQGGSMKVKVEIRNIENLKTSTGIKEEKGTACVLRLITKVQFEAEIDPHELADVHRLLAAGHSVSMVMGSRQGVLELEPSVA